MWGRPSVYQLVFFFVSDWRLSGLQSLSGVGFCASLMEECTISMAYIPPLPIHTPYGSVALYPHWVHTSSVAGPVPSEGHTTNSHATQQSTSPLLWVDNNSSEAPNMPEAGTGPQHGHAHACDRACPRARKYFGLERWDFLPLGLL